MSRSKNIIVAMGLLAFAAGGMAFPFLFVKSKSKPIIDSSQPLPPQATFRGPYINTGSHDVDLTLKHTRRCDIAALLPSKSPAE